MLHDGCQRCSNATRTEYLPGPGASALWRMCFHCMLTQLHFIIITWSKTVLPAAADFTGFNSWPDWPGATLACGFRCKQRRPSLGKLWYVTLWLMLTVRNSICETWLNRQAPSLGFPSYGRSYGYRSFQTPRDRSDILGSPFLLLLFL